MKVLEIIFDGIEYGIEKIPIVGAIKNKIEQGYTSKILTPKEILSAKWLKALTDHINKKFDQGVYHQPYKKKKLKEWITTYPGAFTVLVRRKMISWPINREKIHSTIKILPLNTDIVVHNRNFDPFNITKTDLASDYISAKAIWVGDLTSSNQDLMTLFLVLKAKLEHLQIPIYFRTANNKLRSILFERYGAKVLNPDGLDANANTILFLIPSNQLLHISTPIRN